ncbi:MAG: hypothetical protein J6I84_04265 [Bacilli bacterium]|nr:hypothetical protein [Bacilli bacterium]
MWSEEDENRLKNLYFLIDHSDENNPTKEGFKNWLKSLKDRSLSKQEWSEEDKKMVNDIVDCIKQLPIFYEKIEINGEQVLTSDFIPRARQWLSNLHK